MQTGQCGTYSWIVWNAQFLGDLIYSFPELVVGKHIVVTSFDSGPLVLSEEELQRGWIANSALAYSPRIQAITDIPHDQYDEWYVASKPLLFMQCEVFVNYAGFRLQAADDLTDLQARFWRQLDKLAPDTYLAEGDNLILVTRDVSLAKRICQWQLPRPENQ